MKRERRAAPTGSSHQRDRKWPRRGKRRESVLNITSVLQSWARAITCVVFTRAQPIQIVPFITTVATKAPIATGGNTTASRFPFPGSSFVTLSCRIWRKETIMMMEKTRMPMGSRRRRPTGNLCARRERFHATRALVV